MGSAGERRAAHRNLSFDCTYTIFIFGSKLLQIGRTHTRIFLQGQLRNKLDSDGSVAFGIRSWYDELMTLEMMYFVQPWFVHLR